MLVRTESELFMPPHPFAGLPRKYFHCVLADPAYHHVTYSPKGQGRSASQHYRMMPIEQIAALPVVELVAKNCWLFLWTPSQHLAQAIRLIGDWGFRYSSTAFCWVKTKKSGDGYIVAKGHTTRKSTEICLLGRRGAPRVNSKNVRELIVSPRRQHSRKPDEQYERIEAFCDGPRLELFARQQWPNWHAWGDQLQLDLFGGSAS